MDCKDKAVTSGSDINEFLEEENNEDSSNTEHFDMMADFEILFEGQEMTGPVVQLQK